MPADVVRNVHALVGAGVRSPASLVARLGVPVYAPLPRTAHYRMDTYGITAGQAGDGSPEVVWLLREKKGEPRVYSPGDRLPFAKGVPRAQGEHTLHWGRASVR